MNKDLCRRCMNESLRLMRWNNIDEERWKNGDVFCVVKSEVIKKDRAPKGCKYALEHVVMEDGGGSDRSEVQTKVRRSGRGA
jgi:hypothetical protein